MILHRLPREVNLIGMNLAVMMSFEFENSESTKELRLGQKPWGNEAEFRDCAVLDLFVYFICQLFLVMNASM